MKQTYAATHREATPPPTQPPPAPSPPQYSQSLARIQTLLGRKSKVQTFHSRTLPRPEPKARPKITRFRVKCILKKTSKRHHFRHQK